MLISSIISNVLLLISRVRVKYWNNLRTQQSIFSARFYYALLTLHVSAPFGGHLQVVRKHKIYVRQSLYIQRIRWVGMYKVNIVVS
jgi:hypothetical protein